MKEYKEYVTIEAHREGYGVDQIGHTMTVGELVSYLTQWDDDTPVCISNDNGYTYGSISYSDIDCIEEPGEE